MHGASSFCGKLGQSLHQSADRSGVLRRPTMNNKNRKVAQAGRLAWRRRLVCAPILSCAASTPSLANFTCSGPISYLGASSNGSIYLSIGFGVWPICSLNSSYTNAGVTIDPATCRGWYAAILASKKAGDPVTLYFSSSANTANGPECSAVGSWGISAQPYFLDVL